MVRQPFNACLYNKGSDFLNRLFHTQSRRARQFLPLFILVPAALAAVLMLAASLAQYDGPDANYFSRGAVLPVLAAIFAAISAVAGTVIALLFPKNAFPTDSIPAPFASVASAAGCLLCAIFLAASTAHTGLKWYHVVTLLLLLVSVAYFVLRACDRFTEALRDITVLLGIAPVFGLIFLCAIHYFDKTVEMNAPVKVLTLLGLLTAMVTVTNGIRYLLGTALPRLHLALSSWTVAAGALSLFAIPALFLRGAFDKTVYLASFFIILGYTVASSVRIVFLIRNANSSDKEESQS